MDFNPFLQSDLEHDEATRKLLFGRSLLCVSARRMMIGHMKILLESVFCSLHSATTEEAGLKHLQQLVPDLVLVGEFLEGSTGMAFIRRIKHRYPHLPCLLILQNETSDVLEEAFASGSDGICLERYAGRGYIVTALKVILDGGIYMDAPLLTIMLKGTFSSVGEVRTRLTPRERDVLCKLVEGYRNAEIAAQLLVSVETVRTHMKAIRSKLGARNRNHAALIAVTTGLVRWQKGPSQGRDPL